MAITEKIKVLWLSNVPPIPINGEDDYTGGGWLTGAYESIKRSTHVEISMTFPTKNRERGKNGFVDGVRYFGFFYMGYPEVDFCRAKQRASLRKQLSSILEEVRPDILHVFGTEFAHTQIAIELFNKPERTIIHLQGMPSRIAEHSLFGFPFFFRHLIVPYTLLRGTLAGQARKWKRAGRLEKASIRQVHYIMGRTEWDEACSKIINPSVNYVHCGETLRLAFYEENVRWSYEECKKHSIYFSQSHNQVKGLHLVLPILPELITRYPNLHLYVGGRSPIGPRTLMGVVRRKPLGWYLAYQIWKYRLKDHVTFIGMQDADQVAKNLKKAHIFLSSSLIENSPNSIGEALVVGTPVISSDVGGVKDFIVHGENGFIYPLDEPYMIPYYISKIFENKNMATSFSENGYESGRKAYSGEKNSEILLSTYHEIVGRIQA